MPVSRPAMALGGASHAGTVYVLGSEEPMFDLLAPQLSPQSLDTQLADFEQAAHRQAKECFAGPQSALTATPTHPLYLIIVFFLVAGEHFYGFSVSTQ